MAQQTFSCGSNPRVVITQVDANLSVRAWKEQLIRVETEGQVAELRQEGNTLVISNCNRDLELWVPALSASVISDISVTHLSGDVTIEGTREIELKEIGGNVTLKDIAGNVELENVLGVVELTSIWGDLRAHSISTLFARKGIGGNALLSNISLVEIDSVHGSVVLDRAGTAEILAVGGDLDAEGIEAALRSTTVGADCRVQSCTSAEIIISNVAASLQMEGVVSGHMSVIGENLDLQAIFLAGSGTRFHVGGNAIVTLPDDASLELHAIVGGEMSVEALGSGVGGSLVDLVYGGGAARLDLLVEGDLSLLGPNMPSRIYL